MMLAKSIFWPCEGEDGQIQSRIGGIQRIYLRSSGGRVVLSSRGTRSVIEDESVDEADDALGIFFRVQAKNVSMLTFLRGPQKFWLRGLFV